MIYSFELTSVFFSPSVLTLVRIFPPSDWNEWGERIFGWWNSSNFHSIYAAYRSLISVHLPFLIVFDSLDTFQAQSWRLAHSNSFSCIKISCKQNIKIDHQQYEEFKRWFAWCHTSFRSAVGAPNIGHWFVLSLCFERCTTNPSRLAAFSLFSVSLIQFDHEIMFALSLVSKYCNKAF